ncbi:GIY-YIG nuclease family protein [Bradyrhizobium sp. AZCC 1610]|uniref:GIY-YIG nuclease family protein n=1 Tax=Bradyrhizobium sp. AZCC 1610 TaxID=3117020 RepID=UPI002FEFEF3B
MWYVYFLELSNGDIYVGSTDDLRRRVASQGHVISTNKYLPLILRSYVAVGDEATARKSAARSEPSRLQTYRPASHSSAARASNVPPRSKV